MNADDTADWHAIAACAEDDVPLFPTALLIARDEYPGLDRRGYDQVVDDYVRALRPEVEATPEAAARLAAVNRYLYDDLGFTGNHDHYYDPRNSYLNDVLDRKLGIPISLALVQIEVCRRLGLPLDGVSFPGHFLVRLPMDDGVLVMDPYNRGRPIDAIELKSRMAKHLGGQTPDDEQLMQVLAPATHRNMLVRMLRNLKSLYTEREDWERVARSADRILRLTPAAIDEYRDRGLALLKLDYFRGAREDLRHYLQRCPDAVDNEEVRVAFVEASAGRLSLH
jgi:regulator of sirC expression with transglutaminase-like and TPR domain